MNYSPLVSARLQTIELIIELNKIKVEIPIILMTGFSEHIDADKASKINVQYLEKPLDMDTLLQVIDELLNN